MAFEISKHALAEGMKIRSSMADTIIVWANLESALVDLLMHCLDQRDLKMASAIFYAVTGLDARIEITRRATITAFRKFPNSSEARDIAETIFKNINSKKTIRNTVVHGTISTIGINGKRYKQYTRLTPPLSDYQKREKLRKTRQIPGLSANDLHQSVRAINKLRERIFKLGQLVETWRKGGPKACEQILQELKNPS